MIVGLGGLLLLAVVGYGIYVGVSRTADGIRAEGTSAADIAISAVVAVAMYAAMLAASVGLIDLLQAALDGARISGDSDNLARGLSLLIVATPVFVLLARHVAGERRDRLARGEEAARGWSVHLVAALTTALVGMLVSTGQIIDDITNANDLNASEVAQLIGWSAIWVTYWFGLRPRFGARTRLHLFLGTFAGFSWLISGLIGVGITVLERAYRRLFDTTLTEAGDTTMWLLIAAVGIVVGGWHWRILNGPGSVEREPRTSHSWYLQVIGVALVPAAVTLFWIVVGTIGGTLIWLIGTPDTSAVEWFESAPGVLTVGLIALAVWAYNRWELERNQPAERTEALRLYDYALIALGFGTVVSALAILVNLGFEVLSAETLIADSYRLDNWLIGSLVFLAAGAALWWCMWNRVEAHRAADPLAECGSLWRRLYLIVVAGLGGLSFALCAITILFVALRDIFDGVVGSSTLDEISGPLGWMIAVGVGAWYHVAIWRADRAVQVSPPPPSADLVSVAAVPGGDALYTSPSSSADLVSVAAVPGGDALYTSPSSSADLVPAAAVPTSSADLVSAEAASGELTWRWATAADYGELFTLQRAAFVDEAVAFETHLVPPLTETYAEFHARTATLVKLLVVDDGRIVGAVGLRSEDGHGSLERLMVAPDRQSQGIGLLLLDTIAVEAQRQSHGALLALIGTRNSRLVEFYTSNGFAPTDAPTSRPDLVIMQRPLATDLA